MGCRRSDVPVQNQLKKIGHIIWEVFSPDVSDIFLFDFTIHPIVFTVQTERTPQNHLVSSRRHFAVKNPSRWSIQRFRIYPFTDTKQTDCAILVVVNAIVGKAAPWCHHKARHVLVPHRLLRMHHSIRGIFMPSVKAPFPL